MTKWNEIRTHTNWSQEYNLVKFENDPPFYLWLFGHERWSTINPVLLIFEQASGNPKLQTLCTEKNNEESKQRQINGLDEWSWRKWNPLVDMQTVSPGHQAQHLCALRILHWFHLFIV